jgi:hypothetical protein
MSMDMFLAAVAEQRTKGHSVWWTNARHLVDENALVVTFEFSAGEGRQGDRWMVTCDGLSADRGQPRFRFSEHGMEFNTAEVTKDHPLLWTDSEPYADLDIAQAPRDAGAVVAALLEAHERVVQEWIPFLTFLRVKSTSELRARLAGGSCNLALAPVPLARAYCEVLAASGCRPTLLGKELRPRCDLRVFLFGDDYVCANSFVARRER